jgi:flagellar hook-basal body complex protein FliE
MIEKATSPANISAMLQTLRAHQAEASGMSGATEGLGQKPVAKTGFGDLISNAIGNVNELQATDDKLQDAYDRGENVPLTDVVLGMQKSSLAFEATLQIRNKVLKAYEEILNMPV